MSDPDVFTKTVEYCFTALIYRQSRRNYSENYSKLLGLLKSTLHSQKVYVNLDPYTYINLMALPIVYISFSQIFYPRGTLKTIFSLETPDKNNFYSS